MQHLSNYWKTEHQIWHWSLTLKLMEGLSCWLIQYHLIFLKSSSNFNNFTGKSSLSEEIHDKSQTALVSAALRVNYYFYVGNIYLNYKKKMNQHCIHLCAVTLEFSMKGNLNQPYKFHFEIILTVFKWAIPAVLDTIIRIDRVSQTQLVKVLFNLDKNEISLNTNDLISHIV